MPHGTSHLVARVTVSLHLRAHQGKLKNPVWVVMLMMLTMAATTTKVHMNVMANQKGMLMLML